jgi:hypothetical protein
VAVDIKDWSHRPAPEQARAQQALATVVRAACAAAGLPGEFAQVNGDGILLIAPSGIDETRVIPVFIRALHDALRRENRMLSPGARIRLRTALTEGMIIPAPTGFAGLAVTECFRLLDSPPVRQALNHHPDADLAVIASDILYRDVIAHGYHGLEPTSFQSADCSIPDKGFRAQAWICIPGTYSAKAGEARSGRVAHLRDAKWTAGGSAIGPQDRL